MMPDPWAISRVVTAREEREDRRVAEYRHARRTIWFATYRQRMRDGLEHCRWCGSGRRELTFGHILSNARGGQYRFDNVTILCQPCNRRMGEQTWPGLRSLQAEEDAAPPGQRWAFRAWKAAGHHAKGAIHHPMSPEREALVPRVVAILIANGPDGEPMEVSEVRERLCLPPEDERTVLAALRAARRRGLAVQGGYRQGYLCTPDAQIPQTVTTEGTT